MKLLDAVKNLEINDVEKIKSIIDTLTERKEIIELAEPQDYGSYYEKWCDKLGDLSDIIEQLENLLRSNNDEEKQKLLKFIKRDVIFHQFTYGGLKRLTI